MSGGEASTPTSILAEIRSEIIGSGTVCGAGRFVETLNGPDAAAVEAAQAEGIPASAIARFLQKRGYPGKVEPAVRHLKGRCGCSTR